MLGMVVALSLPASVMARSNSISVKSPDKFYKLLSNERYPFGIVLFYQDDRDIRCDEKKCEDIENLLTMFNRTSDTWLYRDGGLQFIKVNTAKRSSLEDLKEEFFIGNEPVFILFKEGFPITDDNKQIAMLSGFATRTELMNFINENIGQDLQANADNKAEERRIKAERAEYYWSYPYWGWPYYGGWPYYYGPAYGPSVGFGFSI